MPATRQPRHNCSNELRSSRYFRPAGCRKPTVDGHLTTPIQFGPFPPMVESSYFLGVVPVIVVGSPAKVNKTKVAPKKGVTDVLHRVRHQHSSSALHRGQGSSQAAARGWRPVSHPGITNKIGDLCVFLDNRALYVPETCYTYSHTVARPRSKLREERTGLPN